jgi:hypothetical protein
VSVSNASEHSGLLTTFYNWDSTADPVYRIDPQVDFNWNANGMPAPGIAGNNWNVSWEGKVLAGYDEAYTFHVTADDGVRLWVNGTLLVDAVNNQALNTFTGTTAALEAGQWYSIRLEYYQHDAGGAAKLEWSSASQSLEVIPPGKLSCADLLAQQNAAPVNNLPSQQVADLNTPLVFSAANGNAISVGDPEIDQTNSTVAVGDCSFETHNIGTGRDSNQYNPTGFAWTFEGQSGIAAKDSGFLYQNGAVPNGTQAAFLQFNSSIWQDITFAQAGNYTIGFQAAYRVYGGASPVSVFVDGVNVGTFTPNSPNFQGYQTNSFAVTAGIHRVTFSHNTSADQSAFIDQVSIAKTESLVQVHLAVDSGAGTLTLARTDGLMFLGGDGHDDTAMTFSGTLADINAALNGLRYMPTANYAGTFNLQMTSTHRGTIFTGGVKTDPDVIPIYVSVPSDSSGLLALFYNNPGGATVNSTNLALGKTCTQSSFYAPYDASYAVDGNPNTFDHTLYGANEWLKVDLGSDTVLTQIKLINRDSSGERLQGFTVSVIAGDGTTVVWSQSYDAATHDGEVLTFNTGKITGEYILVRKNDDYPNYLHLAEVQVFNLSVPEPDISRVDPTVNFDWGNSPAPAPGVSGNQWSASWQGQILANYSEAYTFHVTADDGVHLWVNDQLLIDSWQAQGTTTHTSDQTITLEAGQWYSIRLDYYQVSGNSGVKLEWSSASQAQEVIPSSQFSHLDSAPVNRVPGRQTTDDNTPVVFSTDNGNAIQVTDADAIYGPLQVTLTIDHGTLTLNNPNLYNLTFIKGDGAGDSTMTFTGQLSDINAALEGLTYTPDINGGANITSALLTMTTDDMAPALTGGSQTSTSTVAIDITAARQYNGLQATYYNNIDFTGTTAQSIDPTVSFDWGNEGSPATGIGGTYWSARWLGAITADYSETYTFHVSADDGFRLFVNNQLVIDHIASLGSATGTIDLVAGQSYAFRMDYTQVTGPSNIKVEWSSASQTREVIPADCFRTADQTPAIASPDVQNGVGNQPIVFSESLGNVIALSEWNNNGHPLTVTLAVDQGTLTLNNPNNTNNLTFTNGDGVDDSTMTFSGSIADINAALKGLCYSRAAGNSGAAALQITASDDSTPTGSRSSTSTVPIGAVQSQNAGLLATYYADVNLGTPVTSRIDSAINFDWGNQGSPAPGVAGVNWSARWEGFIQIPATGYYTFYTTTDDGVRLWINNQLVIDAWYPQSPTTHSYSINLTGGQQYSIRMDYNQYGGGELAKLEWSSANLTREVIPVGLLTHAVQSPVNYLPAPQSVNEGGSLVFSTGNGNAISIVDVDAQSNPLQVTLTAANGTFSLGGAQGLATTTFTGSLAEINAALNGLSFTPTAGYRGAAGLRISTTDLVTTMTANSSLSISVLAANHPPANNVPNAQNVYEHQTLTFSTANGNAISVGDPDIDQTTPPVAVGDSSFESPHLGVGSTAYQYAVLGSDWTFTGTSGIAANGSAFINADAPVGTQAAFVQNGGAISQNIAFAEAGNYTIGFEAAFRPYYWGANPIQVEVDGVSIGVITPTSTDFQSYRTNTFTVSAGIHRVTFRGMNPGGDRTSFLDRVSIDKAQSLVQVSLTVDIGKLNLGGSNGLVFSQGSGNNSNAMTFTGALSVVNAALQGLQYAPLANYEGSDTLRITTNDLGNSGVGGPQSASSTVAITTTLVNDPPVNTVPGSQGTYVNHSIVFTSANRNAISINDPDLDASAFSAPVNDGSFESLYVGNGSINIAPSGYAWTFSGLQWKDNMWNSSGIAALGGNQAPSTPDGRQMAYIQGRATMSQNIAFLRSGDYAISFLSAYRSFYAGSSSNPLMVLVDGVNVGVITPNSLNLQSYQTNSFFVTAGIHQVTFAGLNPQGGDQASFVDQVSITPVNNVAPQVQVSLAVQHGMLTLSGTQGLTFLGGDGSDDATMIFRGTPADINAALSGLRYDPLNGYIGSDSIQIATNDLGNGRFANPLTTVSTVDINIAGGPVVNSTIQGTQQTFPQSPQAVAADANGNYVVVWSGQNPDGDGWDVYARQFNAAGIAQGNEFQVNTNTAGDQMYATVVMNANGGFVVTWSSNNQDGGGWGVYGQRYDAAGKAIGSEFLINQTTASDQMYSSVAIDANGDFAVTWSNKNQSNGTWDVYARVFSANGNTSDEFRVNPNTPGDQMYSRIAMDQNGAFTIVWQSRQPNGDWDIYARSYNADGSAKPDGEFRINDTTAGDQQNANIAVNADGGFVITWTGDSRDGGGTDIYAKRIDATGAVQGGEFRVNTTAAGNQDNSSVVFDRRGNFFITWSSYGQDTPNAYGVYGRRYNADGTASGVETRINGTTEGSQAYSSVTSLSPKDFLVVWSGNAPGDDAGVFQAEQSPPGLLASYFNTADFSGTPVRRIDSAIDFDYGYKGTPIEGFNLDNWSVRWEGSIRANTTETYTFYVDNASSAKLWINGQLVIGSGTSGTISLVAGQWYSIRLDYHQTEGWKDAKLQWSSNQISRELIPSSQFRYENPAPVNFLPGSQSTNEDTPLVFSAGNGNALRISDLDTGADSLEVSLAVDHGTLRLGSAAGLTFLEGAAAGDAAITFRGTLDAINAALDGLQFAPSSNYNGPAVIRITTNDLGSTGAGGAKTTTSTLALNVIAVNDPPVNAVPGPQSILEHQTLIFSDVRGNAIRISDVDAGDSLVQVTLTVNNGALSLGGSVGLTLTGNDGVNAASIVMTGTIDRINAALDGLQFRPDDNYDGIATLRIVTNDLGNTGIGGPQIVADSVAIRVTAVNDPPAIAAPDSMNAYTQYAKAFSENSGNAIRISDPDAGDLPVQVTLSVDQGTVTLSRLDGLTLLSGLGTNDARITMQGTLADINAALEGLLFKARDNFVGTAQLQIFVNDLGNVGIGGEKTDAKSVAINVVHANDPPVNYVPGTQNVLEHQTVTFFSVYGNGISINDPDAGNAAVLVSLTVDHGTLTLGGTHGLTFLSGNGVNNATMSFLGTISDINAALQGLQFAPVNNYDGPASLRIYTNDLGNCGADGPKTADNTIAINVTSINDPPTVGSPGRQSVLEHQALVFSQAGGNAILVGDPDAGDNPVQVVLTLDSGTLTLGGIRGLTFAAGSGPTGTAMTFTGTTADINAALEGMKFVSANTVYDVTVNLRISVNDLGHSGAVGGPQTTAKTVSIGVTAVNDPPTITLPQSLGHDVTQIIFSNAGGNPIIIGDPDNIGGPMMVTIQASEGTFTLASTEGLNILGGTPTQSSFIIVYGTLNSINHAFDSLVFKTNTSFAEMQIAVNDLSTTTGIGGPRQTTQTVYARRLVDPNFTPGDSSGRFQQRTGVLSQQISATAQDILHNSQLQAKLPTLDRDQVGAPLFGVNAAQNTYARFADAGVNERGSDRPIDRGNAKNSEDTFDVRDAKAMEDAKFSADTQNVAEPVQLGTSLRRDENILVGLGIVSAGYLAWAFNGGSLLAGAISATPMWKPFDPLAVLDYNDRVSKSGRVPSNGDKGIVGDDNLQSLLG